jgi:DNA replicative helicase MCM subunit Mcm2 (Cdc46/Mcm family)
MIIYNVTVNIDQSVHDEWLQWMRQVHIPDVMRTGYFVANKILKVMVDQESGGETYSIQYTCNSMNDYLEYEHNHAPRLREEHAEKFKNKFVAFRTLLEEV